MGLGLGSKNFFLDFRDPLDQNFSCKNPGTREPRIGNRELGNENWIELDGTENCWDQNFFFRIHAIHWDQKFFIRILRTGTENRETRIGNRELDRTGNR